MSGDVGHARLALPQELLMRPSIFEVVAQESFDSVLRDACLYLAENFRTLPAKGFNELYTLSQLLLQYSHLASYSASFSEAFYGLKRIPRGANPSGELTLTRGQILKSLTCLCLVPYVRHKLHAFYQDRPEVRWYQSAYPAIYFCLHASELIFQILYALGLSRVHSPYLFAISMSLVAAGPIEASKGPVIARVVGQTLSFSAFFLQFLNSWYSRPEGPPSLMALEAPPPPRKWCCEEDFPPGLCPLCKRSFSNETVLSTSGFVFCYSCIHHHLTRFKECPVTRYPSDLSHLVKIYRHQD